MAKSVKRNVSLLTQSFVEEIYNLFCKKENFHPSFDYYKYVDSYMKYLGKVSVEKGDTAEMIIKKCYDYSKNV